MRPSAQPSRTRRRTPFPPMALATLAAACSLAVSACAADTWTDPESASAEDGDFALQGEYAAEGQGVQVVALGDGQFYVSEFPGGLPGAGWDGSAPVARTVGRDGVDAATGGLEKAGRGSPTLGAEPPEGAVVLFGGEPNDLVKGEVRERLLWAGAETGGEYGSFQLHLEFRTPYKPSASPTSQDRGNSGIYLHNRYEVQVLDSFGLVYDGDRVTLPLKSDPKQWCAALYKFKTPDVPMSYPPLTWQTYDIEFTAPRFEDGDKVANARITLRHNGVTVHDDVELPGGTGAGAGRREVPRGPVVFQGHGNPVAFRNIWLVER